ncbi:Putative acyl-activating enzyme 6 [Glycine soja]|nr:Putative acyl-activating enzyme 6 [Glycine soja]
MYELHFAVPFAGAILNNINTRLDARTVSVILRHANSTLVFVDCASRDLVLEALSLFPRQHTHRPTLILITDNTVQEEKTKTSPTVDNFLHTYEGLMSKGDPNFKWVLPNSDWDPMILNYTSGTTSSPKGVVHCHRGAFISALDTLIDWAVPKNPIYLWTLPMFHANGWNLTWGIAALGGTNICVRKFDAGVVYSLIRNHHVTHMCGAPVVLNIRYGHPAVNEAAVVARPDEYWGETPCAFVSLKAAIKEKEKLTEKDMIQYCKDNMPHYMVPKTVVFKDELPKTSTGKIQKFVLKQIANNMGSLKHSRI